jgi:hypothetical protein
MVKTAQLLVKLH